MTSISKISHLNSNRYNKVNNNFLVFKSKPTEEGKKDDYGGIKPE